jgi:hypothetical protein
MNFYQLSEIDTSLSAVKKKIPATKQYITIQNYI